MRMVNSMTDKIEAMNKYPMYINRMVIEKAELDDKISKLDKALEKDNKFNLSSSEIYMMKVQKKAMEKYSNILMVRITMAKAKENGVK